MDAPVILVLVKQLEFSEDRRNLESLVIIQKVALIDRRVYLASIDSQLGYVALIGYIFIQNLSN